MAATFKKGIAGASLAALSISAFGAPTLADSQIGAIRSHPAEIINGIDFFVSQTLKYESNFVRTANDAETLRLYGITDASDIVSLTEAYAEANLKKDRTRLVFKGHLGYEHYNEFDQFSGVYAGAGGDFEWQFTDRCKFVSSSAIEYALASFNEIDQGVENRQTTTRGSLGAGCFVLDRVRLSADVFGGRVDNEEAAAEFDDLRYRGYQGSAAFVTARKNEIGVRYREMTTERPDNVGIGDYDNTTIDIFAIYNIGEKLKAKGSVGWEVQEDDIGGENERTHSELELSWFPTDRVAVGVDYFRGIRDVEDLAGVVRETDQYGASVNWKFHPRATLGAFVRYEDDTLDAATDNIFLGSDEPTSPFTPDGFLIDRTEEEKFEAGASLRHGVAGRFDVIWSLGYADRGSDYPDREYDGMFASVTVGAKF